MKVSRLLPCLAAGLALAACKDDGPTFVNNGPQAYVRFVNASPDSPNVTARFVDKVENMFTWDRVGYRGNSGNYIAVNSGARNLRVFLSGQGLATTIDSASTVLLDTTVTLQPLTYYTMVMTGRVLPRRGVAPNNSVVRVFTDTLPSSASLAATAINVRVYHMAEGVGPVDVTITSNATGATTAGTVQNVAFGSRSAYATVPSLSGALYTFGIRPAGGTTALFSATPNVPGVAGAAASASSPALDPVAGVQQGRSVMSLFVYPAAPTGTPTAPSVDLIPDVAPPRP